MTRQISSTQMQKMLQQAEDVEWIIATDIPPRVAERVGVPNIDTLVKNLREVGRPDLANRLDRENNEYEKAMR